MNLFTIVGGLVIVKIGVGDVDHVRSVGVDRTTLAIVRRGGSTGTIIITRSRVVTTTYAEDMNSQFQIDKEPVILM